EPPPSSRAKRRFPRLHDKDHPREAIEPLIPDVLRSGCSGCRLRLLIRPTCHYRSKSGAPAGVGQVPFLLEGGTMSHLVTIETRIHDPVAVGAACQRLGLPAPIQGTAQLF